MLKLPGNSDSGELLRAVKEQFRAVPLRGLGYGLDRYLRKDPERAAALAALDCADLLFNYVGQTDRALAAQGSWKLLPKSAGLERSLGNRRAHLLELEAMVNGGVLSVNWTYSRSFHEPSTIRQLAGQYREHLERLIEYCCSPESRAADADQQPLVMRAQP
jgi:non-ribosomal peptide synthase protein (TIGR01720 family)